jgi:tetratricopeptide (TPR) repeat protein
LAIREKRLGPDHPSVATSLNNLAEVYRNQGRYGDADPLYRRSLAILERAFGRDHPLVASTLNNLGVLYDRQGRYAEAEPSCIATRAVTPRPTTCNNGMIAAERCSVATTPMLRSR